MLETMEVLSHKVEVESTNKFEKVLRKLNDASYDNVVSKVNMLKSDIALYRSPLSIKYLLPVILQCNDTDGVFCLPIDTGLVAILSFKRCQSYNATLITLLKLSTNGMSTNGRLKKKAS